MKSASAELPSRHGWAKTATSFVRQFGLAALLCVALNSVCACGANAPQPGERPNVLVYVSDTLRADGLGCYGNEVVETPHLDQFAEEGALYERAYAPSSWTRASMGSILTGTAPAVHGAEGRFDLLADSAVMISELFASEGYRVGSITTNRNVGSFFGFDQGFGEGDFIELYEASREERVSVEELTTLADDVTARAIAWMSASDEPFCLIVHTIDPHSPYMPPASWDRYGEGIESSVDGSQKSLYKLKTERNSADEARVLSLYYGEIAFNDHAFGELIEWMRERGSLDRTAVVFTSDHGEEFWERGERGHGKTLNDKALHVPLILRYPRAFSSGSRNESPVSTLDLLPTLLELARIDVPSQVEGRSLTAVDTSEDALVFSSCKLSGLELYSAQNADWKLVFDAHTGKKKLFDLGANEAKPRDVFSQNREVGRALFRSLTESLKAQTRRRVELHGTSKSLRIDELTEEVRSDLEALGYLGDPTEDAEGVPGTDED